MTHTTADRVAAVLIYAAMVGTLLIPVLSAV